LSGVHKAQRVMGLKELPATRLLGRIAPAENRRQFLTDDTASLKDSIAP
jgi:hypothetical protein